MRPDSVTLNRAEFIRFLENHMADSVYTNMDLSGTKQEFTVAMDNMEYRIHLQNKAADSCNVLYQNALSGLSNDEEKAEFFSAYKLCQGNVN